MLSEQFPVIMSLLTRIHLKALFSSDLKHKAGFVRRFVDIDSE